MTRGIDIFGDVHGEARALTAALEALGYARRGDVHRHPDGRQALFLGDLIDRGPGSRAVIDIVRPMLNAGEARCILGNHEVNAVHWGVPRPDAPGQVMRGGVPAHLRQHGAFLSEYGGEGDPALAADRAWMAGLAPCLDLGELRAVHACWQGAEALLAATGPDGALTPQAWLRAGTPGDPLHLAAETAIKGAEAPLPTGVTFHDKDGNERRAARLRWWVAAPRNWAEAVIAPPEACAALDAALPPPRMAPRAEGPPVVFGHYWLTPRAGRPWLTAPDAVCLDFSVAKGGLMGVYRWDGEGALSPDRLFGVSAGGAIRRATT